MKFKHLGAIALGLAAANAMACYTVYDGANRIAYQGEKPPVDMSQPIHRQIQARYPGGHMMFEQTAGCAPVSLGQMARSGGAMPAPNTAVLDTGRERLVAVVPPSATRPSQRGGAGVPDTAAMGAGPAMAAGVPNTAVMGAAPARPLDPGLSSIAPRNLMGGSSPLLTDKRTAVAMGLPHTAVSGDIVLVQARAGTAGALPQPAFADRRASLRSETVITEMHNPPLTAVQRGSDTVITR
jgi:hypothetical protein